MDPATAPLQGILDAIARARVADKRMQLAESLGDDVGLQIAYQAILHNLFVIGEYVSVMPPELLARDTDTPWGEIAGMRQLLGLNYHRIEPEVIHRTVDVDLGRPDAAVRRLQGAQ